MAEPGLWQAADYSRAVEQHASGRLRSVAHGSVRNELVGRLDMMLLVRQGFETSTVTGNSLYSIRCLVGSQ